MGLLPTNQRDQTKLAIGLIAVALAGYYYSYPYAARAAEIEEARTHAETLEAQNVKARAQATRSDVTKLSAEAARTGASLEMMRRLVPTVNEVPALLEEISTAARRENLEIGGVTPEPVLRGDEFDTYRYKIGVTGGYHALSAFLANVGSLPRIVAPVTFTLAPIADVGAKPASRGGASLAATVTLQAYVVRTPAGALGAAETADDKDAKDAKDAKAAGAASAGETQP